MKRKYFFLVVLLVLLLLVFGGCGENKAEERIDPPQTEETPLEPETTALETTDESETTEVETASEPETIEVEDEPQIDYAKAYDEKLARYYAFIHDQDNVLKIQEGETGVWERKTYSGELSPLDAIGYAIVDVSGDGIPELVIASITEQDPPRGSEIFALYTLVDDKPSLSFEGWERSRFSSLENGEFLYYGSGGANHSTIGHYSLSSDGKELVCKDYYFTDGSVDSYYHNTTGEHEPSRSEEVDMSGDAFRQIGEELEKKIKPLTLISFSTYMNTKKATDAPSKEIKIEWAKDALTEGTIYDEFVADTSEDQVKLLLSTETGVKDFTFLSLTLDHVDDAGKVSFSTKELYSAKQLTPERPLFVTMTFFGDLPSYGISYVDKEGNTKHFSIELSGQDGSLQLSEF